MDSLDRSVAAAFADEKPAPKQTDSTSKKVRAAFVLLRPALVADAYSNHGAVQKAICMILIGLQAIGVTYESAVDRISAVMTATHMRWDRLLRPQPRGRCCDPLWAAVSRLTSAGLCHCSRRAHACQCRDARQTHYLDQGGSVLARRRRSHAAFLYSATWQRR